jgi:hypothetical protein
VAQLLGANRDWKLVILEVGCGLVVPTVRRNSESLIEQLGSFFFFFVFHVFVLAHSQAMRRSFA